MLSANQHGESFSCILLGIKQDGQGEITTILTKLMLQALGPRQTEVLTLEMPALQSCCSGNLTLTNSF